MARLKYQGKEIELADDARGDELVEAENALKYDFFTGSGTQKMLILFFVSIRRADKELPAGVVADQVVRMNMLASLTETEDEGEADTPGPLGNGDATPETAARLTTGSQPTDITST